MEPFDVLNMGNISDFHLEHSNCYLFYVFKFRDPYIGPKKNSSNYGVYGIQNDRLEPTVSTQKYAPGPEILAKTSKIMQVWFGDLIFGTFCLISRDPGHIFQNRFLH